jgi:hypothetical protein
VTDGTRHGLCVRTCRWERCALWPQTLQPLVCRIKLMRAPALPMVAPTWSAGTCKQKERLRERSRVEARERRRKAHCVGLYKARGFLVPTMRASSVGASAPPFAASVPARR